MHLNFRSIICWRLYDYLKGTLRLSIRNFGITCNFNNHLEQYSEITITILAVLSFNLIFFSLEIVNSPLNLLGFYRIGLCEKRIKKSSNNKNKTSKKKSLVVDSCNMRFVLNGWVWPFFGVRNFFLLLFVYQSHFLSFTLTHTATVIRNFSQFLHKSKRYSSFSSQTKIQ